MYRYQMISKKDENPTERQLAELTVEAVAIKLQIDDLPQIHFIEESSAGYIEYPFRINGYCSSDGKYICICHGLERKQIVATTIHEMRHAFQAHDPKWRMRTVEMRERDAELFVHEFFGNHDKSGDAATLTRTLNEILQEDLDRVWKQACASAHARLSTKCTSNVHSPARPAETESSDDLRRRFAPIIKARSRAIQESIDPSGRGLFPSGIEFGAPCDANLKLNYQK